MMPQADDPTQPLDDERIARFKYLTEHMLPTLAREHRWSIRLDHCFKRICLDYAFSGIWYNHLRRPAERHLTGMPLTRALSCAEDLASNDPALLRVRNQESLHYRGKLQPTKPGTPTLRRSYGR